MTDLDRLTLGDLCVILDAYKARDFNVTPGPRIYRARCWIGGALYLREEPTMHGAVVGLLTEILAIETEVAA
jgi:hypothetical protein